MIKKLIALLICIAVSLTAVSCGSKQSPDPEPDPTPVAPDPTPEPDPGPMPWDLYALNKLTGEYDIDKEFAGTRPIAVMVNNIDHCLPQRGIGVCDMLWECEVEGGITRTLAFFTDYRKVKQIGPVRSLRNQFLDTARPYDAMIIHVGSSYFAEQAIYRYGYKTLDAMGCSIVEQDKSRIGKYDSEHTWYTSPELIEACIEKTKIRTEDESPEPFFNFAEYGTEAVLDDGIATSAEWAFSDSYDSKIQYSSDSQGYFFWQHGDQRYDELTGDPICFTNVFIMVASRPGYYGAGVPKYDFKAGGTGYYLYGGKYEKFTWTKDSSSQRFVFKDLDGNELKVNPGRSYVAIVNTYHADTIKMIADQ